jgi:hypothetical protein
MTQGQPVRRVHRRVELRFVGGPAQRAVDHHRRKHLAVAHAIGLGRVAGFPYLAPDAPAVARAAQEGVEQCLGPPALGGVGRRAFDAAQAHLAPVKRHPVAGDGPPHARDVVARRCCRVGVGGGGGRRGDPGQQDGGETGKGATGKHDSRLSE